MVATCPSIRRNWDVRVNLWNVRCHLGWCSCLTSKFCF
jgi:hypothetical protein